jgi:hypothetical protein
MTGGGTKSRRGVYYDLDVSPYEYTSPYGDIFKFSSAKKLEIYARDIEKEMKRFDAFFARNGLRNIIPEEIIDLVKRKVYRAFYSSVER